MTKDNQTPLTKEEIMEIVKEGRIKAHKQQYEAALALYDRDGPPWEELTEEQQNNIMEENRRYWKEMQDLGERISRGEI